MVAEITGQKLDDISPYEALRHTIAWADEPPMLVQIRNLLVQLITLTGAVNNREINSSDLIPVRANPEKELEIDRINLISWANNHNSTIQ